MRGIKVSYGINYAKQYENALLLEQDYELASLHEAMTNGDNKYKAKCVENLKYIHSELEIIRKYA